MLFTITVSISYILGILVSFILPKILVKKYKWNTGFAVLTTGGLIFLIAFFSMMLIDMLKMDHGSIFGYVPFPLFVFSLFFVVGGVILIFLSANKQRK